MMLEAVFKMVLTNTMLVSPVKFHYSPSKTHCMARCLSTDGCFEASYSEQERNCSLSEEYSYYFTESQLREELGWNYYHIQYDWCNDHSYVRTFDPVAICYKIYNNTQLNQTAARDRCWADGGDLITLDSVEKNEYIKSVVGNYLSSEQLFIGLENIHGNWTWPSGNILNYQNWGSGEPSDVEEKCAALYRTYEFEWVDIMCNSEGHFICEMDTYYTYYEYNNSFNTVQI